MNQVRELSFTELFLLSFHSDIIKEWYFNNHEAHLFQFLLMDYTFDTNDPTESFHPNGRVSCIEANDEYVFGIRCDHLIVMDGRLDVEFVDEKNGTPSILLYGNHKGWNITKIIKIVPPTDWYIKD